MTILYKTPAKGPGGPARLLRYLAMPIFLGFACLALYLYIGSKDLDSIERRSINANVITARLIEHIQLAAVSTVIVVVLAVGVGILLTRPFARRVTTPIVGIANIGQAIPSIGLLAILAVVWAGGFWPAVVALVAYSFLSILRNTMVGLRQVDPAVIESGRGMGMTKAAVLARIEMPLAVPVVLAGVRTALVINVGTATIAVLTNAGGLGTIIFSGIVQNRQTVLLTGSILAAVLALAVDYVAGVAEDKIKPRGL
ncbi:MAG: ABC transporter permease [Actinomycetota bacterium]|nr:ABC transporter permease [Actinomycetota bacterium]